MQKRIVLSLVTAVFLMGGLISVPYAMAGKKPATVKEVKSLSDHEQIKLALSAASSHITKDASVMIYGADGTLTEARKGTNGFICVPTVMNLPAPDPMCGDAAAYQWLTDVMHHAPKPTNTVPGIAYMARGGSHFEKSGQVVMSGDGAKAVKEPPHWMIMWPFESATTKLPTAPNPSGVYIMFDGTPYAHLMVYQDPLRMK
jgi:hypothetical protein